LFPKRVSVYNPDDPVDAGVLMPEYLACEDRSPHVARHIVEWLSDPAKREARVWQLAELKERVGYGGASRRAADYLIAQLEKRRRPTLHTHFPFAGQLDTASRGAA
jgi:hypothetical protein